MPKPRKMLGAVDSPYILSLKKLIETQSKETIAHWCIDYARAYILPLYEKSHPGEESVGNALKAAEAWLAGQIKLPMAKQIILDCHAVARDLENEPAAQAAARAVGQAASCIHVATHSLGLAFYGAAAIAYDRVGTLQKPEVYEAIAAEECAKMEAALAAVAVADEPNPAKIKWNC